MAGIVNEAYTLDVNVQEAGAAEQSVNVRSWNDDGTSVIDKTTDASGDITSTVLIAKEHSITGTSTLATTDFNPFQLRALKWVTPVVLEILNVSISLEAPSKQTLFTAANGRVTQTTRATVQAYTGITFNHTTDTLTLDGTGITPIDTMDELYDRTQDEGIGNEQVTPADILQTVDKQNYVMEYDWVVDGFTFDGQNRSLDFVGSKTLTIQGSGGDVQDLNIVGDVVLGTGFDQTAFNNLDVTGDVDLTSAGAGTYTVTDCTWGAVSSTVSGITLNLSGDSSVGVNNNPGNITIQNTKTFTVTDLGTGDRVVWLTRPGEVELENLPETGGTAVYSYNYTVDTDIWVSILSIDRKNKLVPAQLLNSDQTLNAAQEDDPFYFNPV